MTEHTADENTNRETTHTQQVPLEDVCQLEKGDAIALRATQEDSHRIVAGEISSEPTSKAEAEEKFEELDIIQVVALDLNLWWALTDGELTDASHRLEEWPPARPYLGDPPEEAPPCSVACRSDGRIGINIPTPVYRGTSFSRIHHYDTRPYGTIVVLESGDLVNPQNLVPDEYDHVL